MGEGGVVWGHCKEKRSYNATKRRLHEGRGDGALGTSVHSYKVYDIVEECIYERRCVYDERIGCILCEGVCV